MGGLLLPIAATATTYMTGDLYGWRMSRNFPIALPAKVVKWVQSAVEAAGTFRSTHGVRSMSTTPKFHRTTTYVQVVR